MSDQQLAAVYCEVGDFGEMGPDAVLCYQSVVKVVGDEGEEWDIYHIDGQWQEDASDGEMRPCDFADLQKQGFYWYAAPSGEEVARKVEDERERRKHGGA